MVEASPRADDEALADAPAAPAGEVGSTAPSVSPAGDWLHRYTRLVDRLKNVVIVSWIAILIVGLYGITQVFANLKLQVCACGGAAARGSLRGVGLLQPRRLSGSLPS
jgi:hypothetical protein